MPEAGARLVDRSSSPSDDPGTGWASHWYALCGWIDENYPGIFEPDWVFGGAKHDRNPSARCQWPFVGGVFRPPSASAPGAKPFTTAELPEVPDYCQGRHDQMTKPALRHRSGSLNCEAVAKAGCPLFVTDPGLAKLPVAASTLEAAFGRGCAHGVFSDVKPNPVVSNLEAGIAIYRQGGHDGVIAFGGGSALDLGKLIAFQAGQTRPIWDFEDIGDWWTRADADAIAPVIAVPTTAGTGSEVGRAGVLTNEATHTKKVIFHPKMLPVTVIADPELTVGMPPFITAGTGMDALAHCLEAWCAPGYHPMAEGIAAEGVRLVLEPAQGLCRRHRYRGPRAHDVGRRHGRHRLPEGPRRDPFALASDRRALRHASRHDQCRLHAACAGVQPGGDRRQDGAACRLLRHCRRLRRLPRPCERALRRN
jgi:hypothetical protein